MADWIDQWIVPGGSRYVPEVWKDWAPGTRELYSNVGTLLLAYLVERISGEEYTAYCRRHIFDPLGMTNTGFWLSELDTGDLATPYVEGYRPIAQYSSLAYPVGWLRSSVRDFAPFLVAYINGGEHQGNRILQSATVDSLLTLQNPASGNCLIWRRWLGDWYGHDGGGTGFSSRAEFHRGDGIGIIALANFQCDALHPGGRIFDLIRVQANGLRD
jgi:CubicO group peptidase (beta-lactamase class C family)